MLPYRLAWEILKLTSVSKSEELGEALGEVLNDNDPENSGI